MWDAYQVRTFAELDTLTAQHLDGATEEESDDKKQIYIEMGIAYQYASKVSATYTGQYREKSEEKLLPIVLHSATFLSEFSEKEIREIY
ncbi:MAG: hypothetical protein AAF633_19200, partial [Chloroflexota bacterium]